MAEKFLYALIGGVGGGISLALLAFLTRVFNPQGDYILAVVFSIIAFALADTFVITSILLAGAGTRNTMIWLILAIVISAITGGALFPWGTFGFWLSLLPLAVIIPIALHGLSLLAVKGLFLAIAGLVVGGIAATAWTMAVSLIGPSYLDFKFISIWLPFGLITYGVTFGLLLVKAIR